MTTIWQVSTDAIGRLDQASGIDLMERLLHSEARQIGLSTADVVISRDTNVADGGIDAKVISSIPASPTSLISGNTHYQVKSGTSFKPWQEAILTKELFGTKAVHKDSLGDAVRLCLDDGETYCIVTLGHDLSPDQHSKAISLLEKLFVQIGYPSPRVKVLGQGQLRAFVNGHPALPLSLVKSTGHRVRSIDAWKRDSQMGYTLQLGDEQKAFIEQIRSYVRSREVQHLRLIGEPGIGKTRLALTALDTDDLRNSVVYFESSSEFQSSDLFSAIIASPDEYEAVIVIDDCDERDRLDIWKSVKGLSHYKLITIDHGTQTGDSESTRSLQCPLLPDDQIRLILAAYVGEHASLYRWAEWCSGSPRVAHAVGANLKSNPKDLLKNPDDVDIWSRFIDGFSRQSNAHGKVLLRHLALFHKFGFEPPYSHEASFISSLVAETDPSITWPKFQELVQHYRMRRVIQGDKTLFLVPRALQIYLWKDFWENYGRGIDLEKLIDRIPSTMQGWFTRNLNLAHLSGVATKASSQYLATIVRENRTDEFVTSKFGAELLRLMAESVPDEAMRVIEVFLEYKTDEWLAGWTETQQQVVWALERLAVWENTFSRAAHALQRLALTTTATNSNNAKGILGSLFCVGTGWAPTQVSASDRIPFLSKLLSSVEERERALGLELCRNWLSLYGGSRIVGAEHQGARPDIEFWRPKTYGEIFDLLIKVWRVLLSSFRIATPIEKGHILEKAIEVSPQLIQIPSIADEVMAGLVEMCTDRSIERERSIRSVISLMRRPGEKRSRAVRKAIVDLDQAITGTTWQSQYERWCAYSGWDEDYIFRRANALKSKTPEKRLINLANTLLSEPKKIRKRLLFATSINSHRAFHFGQILCRLDKTGETYSALVNALRSTPQGDARILSGYLSQIKRSVYHKRINELLCDKRNSFFIGPLLASLPMSDENIDHLLKLYNSGGISSNYLAGFRNFSGSSSLTISKVISSLVANGERDAIRNALRLVDHILEDSPKKFEDWSEVNRLIQSEYALVDQMDNMTSFYWSRVAKKMIAHDPAQGIPLLRRMIEVDDALSPYRGGDSPASVARQIVTVNPVESWPILAGALESSASTFSDVFAWLTDREHNRAAREVLVALDFDAVLEWAEADKARRMSILGHILPKTLDDTSAGRLTQRALDRFGDERAFAGALYGRFWSGSWMGPRSAHHEMQREQARRWLSATSSPRVKKFLVEFIDSLTRNIEQARSEEEREY